MASSGVSPVRQGQDKREHVLETCDRFLSDGLALKNWFAAREASGDLKTFDLVETFNRPDRSQGFFGEVPLNDRVLPVMGVIDEVFYDQPKAPVSSKEESALWMRDQVREFVLRYFLRISDFRRPRGAVESNGGSWAEYLGPFNLRPGSEVERDGMGFSQVFLKRVGAAEIETVPKEQGLQGDPAITDLPVQCECAADGFGITSSPGSAQGGELPHHHSRFHPKRGSSRTRCAWRVRLRVRLHP